MVPDPALGIRSAVARVDALAVQASPVRRTLGVRGTRDGGHRRQDLASAASAAHVTGGTFANHRPHRQRIDDHAFGRPFARFQGGARVLAHVVETGQLRRTIGVLLALGLRFLSASHVRVAHQSRRATAQGEMILHFALGLRRTRMVVHARVDALAVDARTVVRTIVVAAAADHQAPVVRVTAVTALAPALRTAGDRETFGVRSARVFHYARVQTMAVDARLTGFAFRVSLASDCNHTKTITLIRLGIDYLTRVKGAHVPVLQAKFGFPS